MITDGVMMLPQICSATMYSMCMGKASADERKPNSKHRDTEESFDSNILMKMRHSP